MQKKLLGKTNLEVSRITFGGIICMNETQSDANEYVACAIDNGINYFDVAPSYGDAEARLGPALKPYRKDSILSCKTTERAAKSAKKELENSLKTMQTDYFDLYQLHALSESADVKKAFADDGIMKVLIEAKKAGYIRHLGLTAHNEEAVLEALSLYDFDTVMLPMNWALHMSGTLGTSVPKVCREKQLGMIAIKTLAHRKWHDGEERRYPKSWCKTIYDDDRLGIAAMKYALNLGADTLIPPGNFEQFQYMVKHIDKCVANPLNENDIEYLKANLPAKDEQIFIVSEDGKKSQSNN